MPVQIDWKIWTGDSRAQQQIHTTKEKAPSNNRQNKPHRARVLLSAGFHVSRTPQPIVALFFSRVPLSYLCQRPWASGDWTLAGGFTMGQQNETLRQNVWHLLAMVFTFFPCRRKKILPKVTLVKQLGDFKIFLLVRFLAISMENVYQDFLLVICVLLNRSNEHFKRYHF